MFLIIALLLFGNSIVVLSDNEETPPAKDNTGIIKRIAVITSYLTGVNAKKESPHVYFRADVKRPTRDEIDSVLSAGKTEEGQCNYLVHYTPGDQIQLEATPECRDGLAKVDVEAIQRFGIQAEEQKAFDTVAEFTVRQVAQAVSASVDVSVDQLKVVFEKGLDGKEYGSIFANPGNSLFIEILYPKEKAGKSLTYDSHTGGGVVELGKDNCLLKYWISNSQTPEAEVPTAVLPVLERPYVWSWDPEKNSAPNEQTRIENERLGKTPLGKLYLETTSMAEPGRLSLLYFPESGTLNTADNDRDYLHVGLYCNSQKPTYENTITRTIIRKNPLVFYVAGLWHPPLQSDEKFLAKLRSYGFHIVPHWYDDTAQDIRVSASQLKDLVDQETRQWENLQTKVGKFDLIGYSMGGLVGRYFLANLGQYSLVRTFITLGSPHLGTPLVVPIIKLCPKPSYDMSIEGCRLLKQFFDNLNVKNALGNELGDLGEGILQMHPQSDFINRELQWPQKGAVKMILFGSPRAELPNAWTKEFIKGIPLGVWTAELIGEDLSWLLGLPTETRQLFHDFVLTFTQKDGDGKVPITSSWANEPSRSVGNLVDERILLEIPHRAFFESDVSHKAIAHKLLGLPFSVFSAGSPINLYAYDSFGNVVGRKAGTIQEEIPEASYEVTGGDVQLIFVSGEKPIQAVIDGTGDGTVSIKTYRETSSSISYSSFPEVPVNHGAKMAMSGGQEGNPPVLQIDTNGDGVIDEQKAPAIFEFQNKPSLSPPQEKTGTVDLIFPGEEDSFSPGIIFGIAGLFVILGLWWYRKRKQ